MKTHIRIVLTAALSVVALAANAQLGKLKEMITVAENSIETATKEIVVNSQFCKVNIRATDGNKAIVNGKLEALAADEAYKINFDDNGTTLTATFEVPNSSQASYAGEFVVNVPIGVKVVVKATSGNVTLESLTDCNIDIETVKGKITGKNVAGNLTAEAKAGDIVMEQIDGTFALSTSTGAINVNKGNGTLSFDSTDGAATVSYFSGKLDGKTIAGTQTYSNLTDCNLHIQGSTGAIKISDAEATVSGSLKASTLNLYKVKGEFHLESEKGSIISSGSANGITLTASSDFTTTEGKINLTLINKKDELTFDLAHAHKGDIGLIAKGERTVKKQLKFGKGPIVITGRTNTGTQTYK